MLQALGVNQLKFPCEGPRFIRCPCPFMQGPIFEFDFFAILSLGNMANIQAVYVDNRDCGDKTVITIAATNQRLVIPANAEAFLPAFFMTENGQFTVSNETSFDTAIVFLLNNPVYPKVWPRTFRQQEPLRDSDGNIILDSDGNPIFSS